MTRLSVVGLLIWVVFFTGQAEAATFSANGNNRALPLYRTNRLLEDKVATIAVLRVARGSNNINPGSSTVLLNWTLKPQLGIESNVRLSVCVFSVPRLGNPLVKRKCWHNLDTRSHAGAVYVPKPPPGATMVAELRAVLWIVDPLASPPKIVHSRYRTESAGTVLAARNVVVVPPPRTAGLNGE